MWSLVCKYALSALIIVVVSEVAKRADRLGAIISSLPLTTIMIMLWLYYEQQPMQKIANHAYYTFWYVLPTLPMFLLFPLLASKGVGFWQNLLACCVLGALCFVAAALVLKFFGINLLP